EPVMLQPEFRLTDSKYRTKRFNIPDFQQPGEHPRVMMKNTGQLGESQRWEVRGAKPEKAPLRRVEFSVVKVIFPFEPFEFPPQQEKVCITVVVLQNSGESEKQRLDL